MNHTYHFTCRAWLTFTFVSIGLISCVPPDARAPTGQCQGENRPQLDCSSEFSYDATNMKGGFSALGIGSLSADTERKALRDLDQETERFVAQARRLCDEYNKCVLDRDSYATRSENLRRRIARVPELYDQVKKSAEPSAQRQFLSEAYSEILPNSDRNRLDLLLSVEAQAPGASPLTIREGAVLHTGTHLRFLLSVSNNAYVYLFQRYSSGKFNVLFPDSRMQLQNPVSANIRLSIPPSGLQSFRLDENDLGEEIVYVIASLQPINWLQSTVSQAQASGQGPSQLTNIGKDPNCRSRALSLETVSPDSTCVRQRGLVLSPNADSPPTTIAVRTEAADGVIARMFSFQHTN